MSMEIDVIHAGVNFSVAGVLHAPNDFELSNVLHAGETILDFLQPETVKALEELACEKATLAAAEAKQDWLADRMEAAW